MPLSRRRFFALAPVAGAALAGCGASSPATQNRPSSTPGWRVAVPDFESMWVIPFLDGKPIKATAVDTDAGWAWIFVTDEHGRTRPDPANPRQRYEMLVWGRVDLRRLSDDLPNDPRSARLRQIPILSPAERDALTAFRRGNVRP